MIIHKENDFVICQKPAGISSQKAKDGKTSMIELVANELGIPKESVYPIHRLDNAVGGTMIYAVTKDGARKLSQIVAENKMKKRYLAVICAIPEEKEAVLCDLLFKDSSKNKSYVVKRMRKGVKKASLEYKTLKTAEHDGKSYSLIDVLLHTGRTHQIRVQFASRKMPLAGDRKYGSGKDGFELGLWSHCLEFENPFDNSKLLEFKTEPDWNKMPWMLFK